MYFAIAGVLIVVIIGALLAKTVARAPSGGIAAGATALLIIVTLLFSWTTVSARSVGIQTSFGKYDATLENGTHFIAPWASVEEFSTQIQDLNVTVPVSFQGGSSGEADVTLLWAIDGEQAEDLWKAHKTFDAVRARIVEPSGRTEIAAAFSGYQPEDAKDGANRKPIQTQITDALAGVPDEQGNRSGGVFEGRGIILDSIQITDVRLGARAQESVDRVAEAASNTVRATEEQERAKIEAETAKIRQESQTPEAIQRYCLEILNSWDVNKNGALPATLNCNFAGAGQVPVIVGQ